MNLYKDITKLPAFNRPVITIGTFDGVHLGHRMVLDQLVAEAKMKGSESIVITFEPHPRHILSSHPVISLLSTPSEKYKMLEEAGVDNVVAINFDKEFAAQGARDFVRNFLIEKFHPSVIITGYDHRFGNNREGDYHLLEEEGTIAGFKVKEIPGHVVEKITISSTKIREALKMGEVELANQQLGYNYRLGGKIIHGNELGSKIGFPTANLEVHREKLIPADGVYAVKAVINNELLPGMMNIGYRPTVDGTSRVIEVHILDFNREIYDENLDILFYKRLRDERKFDGIEALKAQLANDRQETKAFFSVNQGSF